MVAILAGPFVVVLEVAYHTLITYRLAPVLVILCKQEMADVGANPLAECHVSQVLSAVAAIVVAVLVAAVLLAAAAPVAVAQVLLHSLTPQVVVVAVAAMALTSAGIVTPATQAVSGAVAQLVRITVLHTEQAAAAELELQDKDKTVLAAILEHQQPIKLDLVAAVALMVSKVFRENHGVMDKVTATTVADHTAVVVVDQVHHTVAVSAAKAQCVLFGPQLEDATHQEVLKIKDGEF